MGNLNVSITAYAAREARKAALQLSAIFFLAIAVVAVVLSFFVYYQRLDYVARAIESNVASSLVVGDTFQLKRLSDSLSKNSGILSVSIFDSKSGQNVAHAGVIPATTDISKSAHHFDLWEAFSYGTVTLRHDIESGSETIGFLEIVCALPTAFVTGLLCAIFVLFALTSYFNMERAKKTAFAIARPTELFAHELNLAAQTGKMREIAESDLRFSEFVSVQSAFKAVLNNLAVAKEREKQIVQEAVVGRIASKVRHDVKQALLASNVVYKRLVGKPEDMALMAASLQRIESTVSEIPKIKLSQNPTLENSEAVAQKLRSHFLGALVEPVCSEFRALIAESNRKVEVEFEIRGEQMDFFVRVEATNFRRMVANLMANSLDAVGERGKISLSLEIKDNALIALTIRDNGKGIPHQVLKDIGVPGFSYGKPNGSGVGLSSAKEYVHGWQGDLSVNSIEGQGTAIEIILPKADPGLLSATSLIIPSNTHILILDDDPTVHEIWKSRLLPEELDAYGIAVNLAFNVSDAGLIVDRLVKENQDFLVLADFDLGNDQESGLDFVRRLGICDRTIIISSNAEDEEVIQACATSSVPLISKSLQAHIPIQVA